jgi:hypothetical protein
MLIVSNSSSASPILRTSADASFLISTLATSAEPTTTGLAKSAVTSPLDPSRITFALA